MYTRTYMYINCMYNHICSLYYENITYTNYTCAFTFLRRIYDIFSRLLLSLWLRINIIFTTNILIQPLLHH